MPGEGAALVGLPDIEILDLLCELSTVGIQQRSKQINAPQNLIWSAAPKNSKFNPTTNIDSIKYYFLLGLKEKEDKKATYKLTEQL